MSQSLDVTTALQVSRRLLKNTGPDQEDLQKDFAKAYEVFYQFWPIASEKLSDSSLSRFDVAVIVADFVSDIIAGNRSLEDGEQAISQALSNVTSDEASMPEGSEQPSEQIQRLIHESESAILAIALKVRRSVEQMPLGQDVGIAVSYMLTLITDRSKSYAVSRTQSMTEIDGYHVFLKTLPIVTDITLDAWSRLGSTYYNPTAIVFDQSYVRAALADFSDFVTVYDMGMGEAVSDLVEKTASFIAEVAEAEVQRFDHLSRSDINGIKLGVADQLIGITERAWRLCMNNLISDVDDLLTDPEAAKKWLAETDAPIKPDSLLAAIRSLYSQVPTFTHDADIDLDQLDDLVTQEVALTTQAAQAMIDEVTPWSM
jgi:hypothetical protein